MKGSRRSDGWVSMLSTVLGVSNCILVDLFSDHEIEIMFRGNCELQTKKLLM